MGKERFLKFSVASSKGIGRGFFVQRGTLFDALLNGSTPAASRSVNFDRISDDLRFRKPRKRDVTALVR